MFIDDTKANLCGFNRISRTNTDTTGYFLDDAIGSVRQVAGIAASSDAADSDPELTILLAQSYSPYGETIDSVGTFDTSFGFTGEMTDSTGLINLRARWYAPGQGRFITKDSWSGDYKNPITLVKWVYANANPVMNVDPTEKKACNEYDVNGNCIVDEDWQSNRLGKGPIETTAAALGLSQLTCDFPNALIKIYHTVPETSLYNTISIKGLLFLYDAESIPTRKRKNEPLYSNEGKGDDWDIGNCTVGHGFCIDPGMTCNQLIENKELRYDETSDTYSFFDQGNMQKWTLHDIGKRIYALTNEDAEQLTISFLRYQGTLIRSGNGGNPLKVPLTQYQWDALQSFVYNQGDIQQIVSNYLNLNNIYEAGEFIRFFGDQKYRRKQEADLFENEDYIYY